MQTVTEDLKSLLTVDPKLDAIQWLGVGTRAGQEMNRSTQNIR